MVWKFVSKIEDGTLLINKEIGFQKYHVEKSRLATPSERQKLIDKLHEVGKYWDAEKLEIVDLKYVPKVGDCVKIKSKKGN